MKRLFPFDWDSVPDSICLPVRRTIVFEGESIAKMYIGN